MTDKEVMQMALDVLANNRHALPIKEVIEALRTALAQHREWVGLTENEKELLWDEAVDGREHFCSQYGDFADTIEAKLLDKNK